MPKQSRIRWTDGETKRMAAEWLSRFGKEKRFALRFFNQIQDVLPEDRRRKLLHLYEAGDVVAILQKNGCLGRITTRRPSVKAAPAMERPAPAGKARKDKVHWSLDEWMLVAKEYVARYGKAPLRVGSLRVVQDALPPERRRRINSIVTIAPTLTPLIEDIIIAPAETIREIEKPVDVEAILRGVPVERLFAEALGRLFGDMRELRAGVAGIRAKLESLTGQSFEPAAANPVNSAVESKPKTRVALIGPLASQFQHYKKRFEHHPLDIIPIDKDKSPSDDALPSSASMVLLDGKFIPHKWTFTAQKFGEKHGIPVVILFGMHAIEAKLAEIAGRTAMQQH